MQEYLAPEVFTHAHTNAHACTHTHTHTHTRTHTRNAHANVQMQEYLAPEVFAIATARNKCDVQYNGKVDVWAAGVIYYIVSRFFVCAPTIAILSVMMLGGYIRMTICRLIALQIEVNRSDDVGACVLCEREYVRMTIHRCMML